MACLIWQQNIARWRWKSVSVGQLFYMLLNKQHQKWSFISFVRERLRNSADLCYNAPVKTCLYLSLHGLFFYLVQKKEKVRTMPWAELGQAETACRFPAMLQASPSSGQPKNFSSSPCFFSCFFSNYNMLHILKGMALVENHLDSDWSISDIFNSWNSSDQSENESQSEK